MKRNFLVVLRIFLVALGVSVALSFTSCSSDSSEDVLTQSPLQSEVNDGKRLVTVYATSEGGQVKFGSGKTARTIMPDTLGGNACDYYLQFKGVNVVSQMQKVSFTPDATDDTKGTFNKTFEIDNYEMKLYAVKSGFAPGGTPDATTGALDATGSAAVVNAAILSSYATIDLHYSDKLTFYLTPNGTSGKGFYDISIVTDASFHVPAGYTVTAGIYGIDDDTLKAPGATPADVTLTVDASGDINAASALKDDGTAAPNGLQSGTYNVKVSFTDTARNKTYVYSERLIIIANQTSTGTITLVDVIEKAPNPPANFIAGYRTPVEMGRSTSNFYEVEFAWSDASNRELAYEIDLMRVDDADPDNPAYIKHPTTDAEWAAKKTAYCTDTAKVFDNDAYKTNDSNTIGTLAWASDVESVEYLTLTKENLSSFVDSLADGEKTGTGSLNMNSSHVKVLLPMDHRFIARIRATNLAGESPYVYLVLGDGATVATTMNTTYNINGDTTKDYTSDVSVGAYTLQTTAFPKAYTDDDPTKAVLATPQVLNLFKIEYHPLGGKFSTISSTGSGVNVDSSIALKKYATQYTDLTDPANPAASTVRVEILCPDSKAKHASATPPITAQVLGKKNSKDSMGLDNASELELMTDAGYFWKQWTVGAENGDPYSATGTVNANTSIVPPDMYTGYKSLDLFAVYMTEKDLTPDVIIQNLRDYELKKEFVTLALFTEKGGTATTAKYKINGTSATDITMFPNPLLIKLDPSENTWKVGDLQVKLSNTKYTPVGTGGSDVDINYDKSEVMMTRLRDGMVVAKQTNNVATDAFDIELKGYETGKYIMSIRAYKDTYQYQLQWVFDMVSD